MNIGSTDYLLPLFCSGCEQDFSADDTVHVADYGSAFPQFCSEDCAPDDAEEYRFERLIDEGTGDRFIRLVEKVTDGENR